MMIKETPADLVERLFAFGIRPRNRLVFIPCGSPQSMVVCDNENFFQFGT